MAAVHYRLKNKITTAQSFFATLGVVIAFGITYYALIEAIARSQTKVKKLSQKLPGEIISKENIRSILKGTRENIFQFLRNNPDTSEEDIDRIYQEIKEAQYQILKTLTKNKAVPYAGIIFDTVFASVVCVALFSIPYLKINKPDFLTKEFCNVSAIIIACVFGLGLIAKSLWENLSYNLPSSIAHSSINSNTPDEQVANYLQILKCTRQNARKMSKKEFKAKFKEGSNEEIKNLTKIICDEDQLKNIISIDLANPYARVDLKKTLGLSVLAFPEIDTKDVPNLYALITVAESSCEPSTINSIVTDYKIEKAINNVTAKEKAPAPLGIGGRN